MSSVSLIAPLTNISCPPKVHLADDTEIHTIPEHLNRKLQEAISGRLIRHPSTYTHCLVVRNHEITEDDRSAASERLKEAVLRLRLYKPGGIGFNFGVIDRDGWYDEPDPKTERGLEFIAVFFYFVWERPGLPTPYDLDNNDIERLQCLFALTSHKSLMDKPAYRYFFRAYHEPYGTDRFLSNAIALENLLVNDQRDMGNIRYKFVDRGCFLLQRASPHPDGAEAYTKPLKAIYDARCKLVHSTQSSQRDWGSEQEKTILRNSEQYLRQLLVYVLSEPAMESSQNVDAAKRKAYA